MVKIALAMLAFAANSLFCRLALAQTEITPSLFNLIRLISGAACLVLLTLLANRSNKNRSFIRSIKRDATPLGGLSLFVYAICFALAYVNMTTGTGALLLFGSVQLTMIAYSVIHNEHFSKIQWLGFLMALAGMVTLLLPTVETPPSVFCSNDGYCLGMAWGAYSLLGRKSSSPLMATTGNFIIASLLALITLPALTFFATVNIEAPMLGVSYALASGIFASAIGYAIWYSVLPSITSTSAATVQLSVPAIATIMGWAFLDESLTLQIIAALMLTLGGIYIVIRK
ncbi:DMT family transporter [Alteromonas gracilis]|uniref:DMT family transporter n=1 Tax=Alteromonas gracilis TaxID=1479524 RepID=UPI00321A4A78